MAPTQTTECTTARSSDRGAGILSNCEVWEYIRGTSPIFHVPGPAVGPVPPEIRSEYDKTTDGSTQGFCLWPNSIVDIERRIAFNTHVYKAWIQNGAHIREGATLPGISFVEATGYFKIEGPASGPSRSNYIISKDDLQCILRSLISVALSEAVKHHLVEGGDERLHLQPAARQSHHERGINKYHCPPHPVPRDTIVRGSCTCSPPSVLGFESARACLRALWSGDMSVEDAFGDIRLRVSKILGIKTAHHVILHPSGTDAELTALLAGVNQARQLGCSGVVNIVVGAKEVGSNTATAAGGKHFSKHFPVSSTNNPEDEAAQGGNMFSPVAVSANGIENGIQVVEIAARLDDGSMVPNFDALVLQTMENATLSCKSSGESGPFFVLHVVDGSKLGSHITSRSLLKRITCQYGDRVLFVLDACQARTSTGELDWYLARNAVVLMTASKFYGAPGFCAAALVPHKIAMAGLFIDTEPREPGRPAVVSHNLGKYITKLEVPRDLEALRATLPARPENVGLLLRWSCGVFEMDRFAKAGQKGQQVIAWWVDGVRAVVRSKRPHVLLLRDTGCEKDETVPFPAADTFVGCVNSIVSFCVITGASKGDGTPVKAPSTMSAVDLRRFHRWLTIDMEGVLPEAATDDERRTARLRCFIGQPVDLGKLAVLRLAISASLASDLADGSRRLDEVLADDGRVLDKILLVKKYYGEFCAWDAGEL